MANYQVNYDINVFAEDAVQAIGRFTMATQQLQKAAAPFQKLNQRINGLKTNLASLSKVKGEVFINTKNAEAKIDMLLRKIERLKASARSINLAVGAGGGGGVATATSRGRAAVSGGSARRVSRAVSASYSSDPVIANWQRMSQKYAAQAKLLKSNAAAFGVNPKNDPLYQRYMAMSNAASRRVFELQNPKMAQTWKQARQNYVPPVAPARGARGGMRGGRYYGGRSIFPNALGYKVLGATPLDVGGLGAVDMMKGMGVAYGIMGIGSLIGGAINDASSYDNIITTTKNILGAHDNRPNFEGRFRGMEHLIRNIGVKTKFTAPQVADASKFLAMAGLNIEEINDAMRPITDIALIADTDLGETADVVTNIMTAYGMKSSQMRDIADKMTMTFTMSNTTLPEMAESYKYFASLARANNWSFDETTAMIGLLGDAGLKGSHAGTTIRQLMANLLKPSKSQRKVLDEFGIQTRDEQGNLRSPFEIFTELAKAGARGREFELFRITAAQGGSSLLQSIEKWNKIIEENRNSSGLSSNLAEAKQNTVQGLWAQVTSMFTEGAMQAFDGVKPEVQNMLKGVTEWLATDESRTRLKAFAHDILDFAKVLGHITTVFIEFYEKFKGPILLLMEWQLKMWPVIYGMKLLRSAFQGGLFVIQKFSGVLRTLIMLGTRLPVAMRGGAKSILQFRNASAGFTGAGAPGGFGAPMGSEMAYYNAIARRGRFIQPEVWNRYVARTQANSQNQWISPITKMGAGAMLRTGAGAIGGGILGAYIGDQINSDYGGMIGGLVGTAAGGALMAPGVAAALFTNPVGWAALAVGGIAAVTAYIIDVNKSITEGIRLSQEWGKSFRNLGVDGLDMTDPDSLVTGGIRIMNNALLDQNEKLTQAIDLWNKYYRAKNGGEEAENAHNDTTPFIETAGGSDLKQWLERADQWGGVYQPFTDLTKQIGQHVPVKIIDDSLGQMTDINGFKFRSFWLNPQSISYMPETAATQIAFAKLAADIEHNPDYLAAEKYLRSNILGLSRSNDAQAVFDYVRQHYIGTPNQSYANISSETGEELTWGQITTVPSFVAVMEALIGNMVSTRFQKWVDVLQEYDANGEVTEENAMLAVQSMIGTTEGMLFDPSHGIFGTEQWVQYWQNAINNPSSVGMQTSDQVLQYISQAFQLFSSMYNSISQRYQGLFAGFMNQTAWDALINYQPIPTIPAPTGTAPTPLVTNWGATSHTPLFGMGAGSGNTWGLGWGGNTWGQKNQTTIFPYKPGYVPPANTPAATTSTTKPATPSKPKAPVVPTAKPVGGGGGGSTHTGPKASDYKSHYNNNSAAPKQVIVKIENLMNVKSIDLTNADNAAVIDNVKSQLTQALIDVVHDFDETYHG